MQNSKTVHLLKSLSRKELKKLSDFIMSPFFNKDELVIAAYKLLVEAYPYFNETQTNRYFLFEQLFANEPYNEQQLRYVLSNLTKLIEQYLAYAEFTKTEYQEELSLISAYNKRSLSKYFNRKLQLLENKLQKTEQRSELYYLTRYLVEGFKIDKQEKQKERQAYNPQQLMHFLDAFFMAAKLKHSCNWYNNNTVISLHFEQPVFLDEILHIVENQQVEEPYLSIYYKILQTFTEPENTQHYEDLLTGIRNYETIFSQEELKSLYVYVLNYCISQYNKGKNTHLLYKFYKQQLQENGVLFSDLYFSESDYKNIITISLNHQDIDFAKEVLHIYKNKLAPAVRKNAFAYNAAFIAFAEKKYQDAILQFQMVEFTNVYYHLGTKVTLIKCYYELNEMIALINLLDTFNAFLRRNKKLTPQRAKIYALFTKFVRKLAKAKMNDAVNLPKLKSEIIAAFGEHSNNSVWFLKKLNELM